LSSTLDAFASIIANNQNLVLKRLAAITIMLQFPVLVASIYGMNVRIPYQDKPHAFYIPIILALSISIVMAWYFMRKKWF
jgi:magnesium transporter